MMSYLAESEDHIEKLIATIAEQQARIEALEAALRKILADCEVDEIDPLSGSHGDIARAALAPE
jgi:uncharacterized coiled-coil protein SlyX